MNLFLTKKTNSLLVYIFFLAFEVYLLETLLTRQHHILFLHLTIGSKFAPDPLNKEVYSRLVLVHPIRYSSYSVKIFNPSLDVMSIFQAYVVALNNNIRVTTIFFVLILVFLVFLSFTTSFATLLSVLYLDIVTKAVKQPVMYSLRFLLYCWSYIQ